MNNRVSLQLPAHTFSLLCAYVQESGSGVDPEELAATAISAWVGEARNRAEAGGGPARGYQWKELFLPSGSHLRMYYAGQYHYALVDGDELVFNNRRVSPAQMANSVAGGTRNAWRDLWLRLPGETTWKLASVRRRQARLAQQAVHEAGTPVSAGAAAQPAGGAAPTNQAEAVLRRLTLLLEQSLEARAPQYRRRSDFLDKGFDDD